ncbi:MAG: hypothetical protein JWN77_1754 [Frankiales bacterium]|nr:hypothetical protein [Frankiales bacterium]
MGDPTPVAVITGSASGIGLELARLACHRGMRVVVTSRSTDKAAAAVASLGADTGSVLGLGADLRREEEVESLVEQVVQRFGRIDLWVNNAAGLFFAPAQDITPNGWRAIVDVNLNAVFLCCRAVFPVMQRQSSGCIVNISSIAAYRPHPGAVHYAAAKAAVNSLTQTLGVEWAPYGIRVNGVALGPVLTAASRFNDPDIRAAMEAEQPTGRIATADEVADIVLSLAAIESTYFTGETVQVDGGYRSVLRSPLPAHQQTAGG